MIRQEADDRYNQLVKKCEFDGQVHHQESSELRERLNTSTATMISMESKIRELSKMDTSVPELLRQVREAAETELKQYKAESENHYSRNVRQHKLLFFLNWFSGPLSFLCFSEGTSFSFFFCHINKMKTKSHLPHQLLEST